MLHNIIFLNKILICPYREKNLKICVTNFSLRATFSEKFYFSKISKKSDDMAKQVDCCILMEIYRPTVECFNVI